MTGIIKRVVEERGFGFIEPSGPGPDVFFHMSALAGGLVFNEQLRGQRVEFDRESRDGRSRATSVRPAN